MSANPNPNNNTDLTDLPSRIDSVVVFRQGARVERTANVPSGSLPRRLRLTNLPLSLDDASVRISVKSTGAGSHPPIASSFRVTLDVAAAELAAAPPEVEELRDARRGEAKLAAELGFARARRARLDKLSVLERPHPKRGDKPEPSPAAARMALIALSDASKATLDSEVAALEVASNQATERRAALEQRVATASSTREPRTHQLRKCIELVLEADADGEDETTDIAALRVSYAVPGARWAPAYSVKLNDALSKVALSVRALVSQRTGEDWSNVSITCSTAAAQQWVELPELPSLRIGRYQPEPVKTGFRDAPTGAEQLYADIDRAIRPVAPPPAMGGAPMVARAEEEFSHDDVANAAPPVQTAMLAAGGAQPPVPMPPAGMPAAAMSFAAMAPPAMAAPGAPPLPRSAPARRAAGAPLAAKAVSGSIVVAQESMARSFGATAADEEMEDERVGEAGPHVRSRFAQAASDEPGDSFAIEEKASLDLRADDPLIDYPALRIRPYDAPNRGQLIAASLEELYFDRVTVERVSWSSIALSTVRSAAMIANGIAPLPARHRFPEAGGYDHAFASETPGDIPSDGSYHTIPLITSEGTCEPHFVVVPRESTDAFRVVEFDNPIASPILPGPADVYVGDRYLMTSDLSDAPPGGTIRLGLGVEQRIKVARNASFAEETRGLMRGTLDLAHQVKMEIVSHLPTAARVEVRERLPVTRDKEENIKVTVDAVDPAWEAYEQPGVPVRGAHRWWVDVGPGDAAELSLAYTIRIASKSELVGGNRRER